MKIILFVLLSFGLAQELEVDGNLKVIGNVQVGTIDSLEQEIVSLKLIIAQLQAQIALLETQMAFLGQDLNNADCFGVVGGDAVVDACGVCDGNNESIDACGLCGGEVINSDDCDFIYVYDQDGNAYHTIQIGDKVWMQENIRTLANRLCYDNDPENCEIYGGLYLYPDALNACPSGWHTATENEFINLYSYYGGQNSAASALKDDELWDGTNESGFSLLPAGNRHISSNWDGLGDYSFIWLDMGGGTARDMLINSENEISHHDRPGSVQENHYFSVRCVQN